MATLPLKRWCKTVANNNQFFFIGIDPLASKPTSESNENEAEHGHVFQIDPNMSSSQL